MKILEESGKWDTGEGAEKEKERKGGDGGMWGVVEGDCTPEMGACGAETPDTPDSPGIFRVEYVPVLLQSLFDWCLPGHIGGGTPERDEDGEGQATPKRGESGQDTPPRKSEAAGMPRAGPSKETIREEAIVESLSLLLPLNGEHLAQRTARYYHTLKNGGEPPPVPADLYDRVHDLFPSLLGERHGLLDMARWFRAELSAIASLPLPPSTAIEPPPPPVSYTHLTLPTKA